MAATFYPSNFVTPSSQFGANPNWEVAEAGKPEESTFVEYIHDRLMVCQGVPILGPQFVNLDPGAPMQNIFMSEDHPNSEVTASFTFDKISLQQCTGIRLEKLVLSVPPATGSTRSSNLTETLCGDLADDAWSTPRRVVWTDTDMSIAVYVNGRLKIFDLTRFIPTGQAIGYHSPAQLISYLSTALNSYMHNVIGDSSFDSYIYVDDVGARFFFTSAAYLPGQIRLFLFPLTGSSQMSALQLIQNHINFTTPRVDTSQSTSGESMGLFIRAATEFQNNSPFLTVHSNELTQFRKSDSICPVEGSSLIGVCTPVCQFEGDDSSGRQAANGCTGTYVYTVSKGSLDTPKIAFDRNKAITSFDVILRVAPNNTNFTTLQVTSTELASCRLSLVFRVW